MTATANDAFAEVQNGIVNASIEVAAPPDRVFRAISSPEVAEWWGSSDLYRVEKWVGDLRVGGKWQADTRAAEGGPEMIVRGEFTVVDPPRVLEHTWEPSWEGFIKTLVRYELTPTAKGTLVTVVHSGFAQAAEAGRDHADGWKRVLGWLSIHFS